ncbi:MAG: hypothetical protein K2N28_04870 [Muribaculaceae bacterium]|nr:hypothetical protein [Muribaculaceae bacterium]
MADNYLERRMDEYRRSQQGATVKHVRPTLSTLRPGQVAVDYPPQRVLVTAGTTPDGQAIVKLFRQFACRVAFTAPDSDRAAATRLAQLTGAQYHPGQADAAVDRLATAGDPATVIIDLDGSLPAAATLPVPPEALAAGPKAVAAWCVFAAHPANKWTRPGQAT